MKLFLASLLFLKATLAAECPKFLRARVLTALEQHMAEEMRDKTQLVLDTLDCRPAVPREAKELRVSVLNSGPAFGAVGLELDWMQKGFHGQCFVSSVVRGYAQVAATRFALKPGDRVSESVLSWEKRELSTLQQTGFFLKGRKMEGMVAQTYIPMGTVLQSRHLSFPPLVARGEWVDLMREKQNIKLTARVKSLENGSLDQKIRVEAPQSKKILTAIVVGENKVVVP